MSQLIYVSQAGRDISPSELAAIANAAADRNLARDVTGTLLYCRGYFLQMLEGDEAVIRELFDKISGDDRHVNVHLLSCNAAVKRLYPAWGMSFLHMDASRIEEAGRVRAVIGKLRQLRDFAAIDDDARDLIRDLRRAIDIESGRRAAA